MQENLSKLSRLPDSKKKTHELLAQKVIYPHIFGDQQHSIFVNGLLENSNDFQQDVREWTLWQNDRKIYFLRSLYSQAK